SLDASDKSVVDLGAVFEAETRIVARRFALQALVHAHGLVDGDIAVGMSADLPAGEVGLARAFVLLGFGHHQQTVIVGTAFIWLGEARCAFGNRAVAHELAGADADEFVTKTGADAGDEQFVEFGINDEAVDAEEQIAGLARVLIGAKIAG